MKTKLLTTAIALLLGAGTLQNAYAKSEDDKLVESNSSLLASYVDIEKTSIDYDNGKIKVVLKNQPHSVVPFSIASVSNVRISIGDEITNLEPKSKEFSFAFSPKSAGSGQQDKLITLEFYYRVKTADKDQMEFPVPGKIYGVTDKIQLFNGKGNRAILASRELSETRPRSGIQCKTVQGVSSECNNFFETDEIPVFGSSNMNFPNTLTHRIVDFDKVVGLTAINNTWAKSPYGTNAYKNKSSTGDNGRIPLLLIHGWQGDKDLRNPAKLGLWQYSELHYWQHFLDYYLTSTALQKKYHLYLYHYPSYKHVTYNASVLNDLLQEVGQTSPNTDLGSAMTSTATNTPQNNLTIIAHSMGGMVARSLIEEYQGLGDSKVYGASMNKLNKLITLDTPHHGSTASDPSSKLAKIPKDMLTQGAADLNWDNYDNQLQNDVVSNINQNYRWVNAEINNQEFDSKFCNAIDCNNTANPWLLNMNKNFESLTNSARGKYVLYVAWMSDLDTSALDSDANVPVNIDTINNGIAYSIAETIGIPSLPNGVAEPITSALLSKFDVETKKTSPFNPLRKDYLPALYNTGIPSPDKDSWILFKETLLPEIGSFTEGDFFDPSQFISSKTQLHSILIPTESIVNLYAHPYDLPYRIFWDYDHEKMVNGAYLGDAGIWDQFISKGVTTNDLKTSAFISNSLRNYYIFAASSFRGDKTVLAKNPATNKTVYNPLKTEPLYLILERDLLNTTTNNTVVTTEKPVTPVVSPVVPPPPIVTKETFPTDGYTKIANDGSKLPDSATLGANPKDWACTRDNKTGLIWEVKTTDGGLRDWENLYSWYEPDASKNGGFEGYTDTDWGMPNCSTRDNCNTYSFKNAVNTQGLCGKNDWRMPTKDELKKLVYCSNNKYDSRGNCRDYRSITRPAINTSYFPNTGTQYSFWSSSSDTNHTKEVVNVNFYEGFDSFSFKGHKNYVRLVR